MSAKRLLEIAKGYMEDEHQFEITVKKALETALYSTKYSDDLIVLSIDNIVPGNRALTLMAEALREEIGLKYPIYSVKSDKIAYSNSTPITKVTVLGCGISWCAKIRAFDKAIARAAVLDW